MKGIILAGGNDKKLHPVTLGIPKQLIPIYDKPMIYYPIESLVSSGIKDILIITSAEEQWLFQKSIGSYLDANYSYAIQNRPNGIAEALIIGRDFIGQDSICLITGDTIISGENVNKHIQKAIRTAYKSGNATIFVENKSYPEQYGKVILTKDRKPVDIKGAEEVNHYYSIAGLYVFPNSVLSSLKNLKFSERGRLEVLDLNKDFFNKCKLQVQVLDEKCIWFDTNSFDSILKCAEYMRSH